MKKFVLFLVLLFVAVNFSSCVTNGYYEEGYAAGYDDGYSDAKFEMTSIAEDWMESGYDTGYDDGYIGGCEEGYVDGFEDCESELSGSLDWKLSEVRGKAKEIFGISPYEAVQVITNYADDPSEISEDDLIAAIGSISYYYEYSNSAIYDLIE